MNSISELLLSLHDQYALDACTISTQRMKSNISSTFITGTTADSVNIECMNYQYVVHET
jgi:hypothetical protein